MIDPQILDAPPPPGHEDLELEIPRMRGGLADYPHLRPLAVATGVRADCVRERTVCCGRRIRNDF